MRPRPRVQDESSAEIVTSLDTVKDPRLRSELLLSDCTSSVIRLYDIITCNTTTAVNFIFCTVYIFPSSLKLLCAESDRSGEKKRSLSCCRVALQRMIDSDRPSPSWGTTAQSDRYAGRPPRIHKEAPCCRCRTNFTGWTDFHDDKELLTALSRAADLKLWWGTTNKQVWWRT